MFLPIRGVHDLGQGRSLGPPDQFQDFRALALGSGRDGLLGAGRLGGLGRFLWRNLGFGSCDFRMPG